MCGSLRTAGLKSGAGQIAVTLQDTVAVFQLKVTLVSAMVVFLVLINMIK